MTVLLSSTPATDMFSWFRTPFKPVFFLGAAAPLAIIAYALSWSESPPSSEKAKFDSIPLASGARAEQTLLKRGFLSLRQYCQSPRIVPKPKAAPAAVDAKSPSPTPRTPAVSEPPCPNWLAQRRSSPEKKDLSDQKQRSKLELAAFLDRSATALSETAAISPDVPLVSPFPQIHRHARLARVPILMYHDILPKKEVFFDVTPQELEAHFQSLQREGATPINPDWLLAHLRTGVPLPEKPVLLTFDDGYGGHYHYVYPLLKKYGYPAVFSVYTKKMAGKMGRTSLTWGQLREMAADRLVTIASHTVSHPKDLRALSDDDLFGEVLGSKRILEKRLGIPIHYLTYPEGQVDARVKQWAIAAGYQMAFSMDDHDEKFAGDSSDLLALGRFGQSRLGEVVSQAWGGYPAPVAPGKFNFATPIGKREYVVEGTQVILITGGRPQTIHADSRYQVPEILKDTGALAGVDGGFFSLKFLDSNTMIGPVLSSNRGFIAGNASENRLLRNRPLALISPRWVKFIPFVPERHNTLVGIQQASPDSNRVTDAFVGAAWLVRDGRPQPAAAFGNLRDFEVARHRAFWGINQAGQPVIGVSKMPVDSLSLGRILHELGLRDAIMLDSGASTSLAYRGESLAGYKPRPVPHAVALFPASFPAGEKIIRPTPLARQK